MEKINIAELLKDCPQGMELDCTVYDDVKFDKISAETDYPIHITVGKGCYASLTKFGRWDGNIAAKCVIFPKGKNTWEGFVPPCKFKDGDIVATNDSAWIGITTGGDNTRMIPTYCIIKSDGKFEAYLNKKEKWAFDRVATKVEKEALFSAIKENGYTWNPETKTLEKLVNKFDISSLKPFQKLLVRDSENQMWKTSMWECYQAGELYPYFTMAGCYKMCIPYESNEYLLGTTDDCKDFYKTWE